jgi:hypothetical protein
MTSRAPQRSLQAPTNLEESLKKTVEDQFMKNIILVTTLAMLTGTIVLKPLNALAQSAPAQNAPAQDPKQIAFLQTWHDACSKKDAENAEKCCQLSKELTDKYPDAGKQFIDYAKNQIGKCEMSKAFQKFAGALQAFYASAPEANKLDALFTAGDDYLEVDKDPQSPAHLFIVVHQPLAGKQAVAAGVYKNLDGVKTYAERALQAFETLNPPEKYKKEYTDYNLFNLRDEALANLNYYLGYYLTETKGDQPEAQNQALAYVDKSIQIRSKDSKALFGWKDPNNYSLRSYIYTKQYMELRKKHDALPEEQKNGDTGKELIKQINQLTDTKMIPEYARIIATATDPVFKDMMNDAMGEFNKFWKFRVDDPSKAPAYLKSFEADPTIAAPPVPAKADDGTGAAAPTVSEGTAKLSAGAAAVPGTGAGKAANGAKASGKTPTKGKTTTKGGRKRKP